MANVRVVSGGAKMSEMGIQDFKDQRQKEKEEMQNLNSRLWEYISKTNFLEAQNKKLEEELTMWRNQKGEDLQPIRDRYEKEMSELRVSLEVSQKGSVDWEGKYNVLQKECSGYLAMIATLEGQIKDYRKKIDSQSDQLGDYEGEMHTLRMRVSSLEDDSQKLRELLNKLREQNKELRGDLDMETVAHLEADVKAQAAEDEAQFYKDILDNLEQAKREPVEVKGFNAQDYWNSHIKKALREINAAYDDKVGLIQADAEAKFQSQIARLKSGDMKNSMAVSRTQEEIKKLRAQLGDKNKAYGEMATRLALLQSERDDMFRRCEQAENDLHDANIKFASDIKSLELELAMVMDQLNALKDAKLSMELEIACYKKLLEGEEQRVGLKSLVEQATDTQSAGAARLAELIG